MNTIQPGTVIRHQVSNEVHTVLSVDMDMVTTRIENGPDRGIQDLLTLRVIERYWEVLKP